MSRYKLFLNTFSLGCSPPFFCLKVQKLYNMSHPESIGQKLPGFPKLKKKIRKRKVHFGRGVNWESVKEEEVSFDVNIEKKMEELER